MVAFLFRLCYAKENRKGGVFMFEKIGQKIKILAQVVAWIGIAISYIAGIVLMAREDGNPLAGLLIMALGSLSSWIGSFMTYGFGQLIENSDILVAQGRQTAPPYPTQSGSASGVPATGCAPATPATGGAPASDAHKWRCEGCGNPISAPICPYCKTIMPGAMDTPEGKRQVFEQWKRDGVITEAEYRQKIEELER